METSRVVDLSVLGRPSTQQGGQKIPSPSPHFMGPQPIHARELLQHAPTSPHFEVGSRTAAPQFRRTDQERMGRAQTPVNEIEPFPCIQQSNLSTDGRMRSVPPPCPTEGATPNLIHEWAASHDDEYIVELSTTRLYLGNVPLHATKQDIENHFSTHGTGNITEIKLFNCYSFITCEDAKDAQDIMSAFHGSDFMGSRLTVQFARAPRHTDIRPRGQSRLVREGAGEVVSPPQVSEEDGMPRDFEMQMQMQREQHLKNFAINGHANPEQTPEMPPRFQRWRKHYEDEDVRNTGAESETSDSSGKGRSSLDIVNSINDDAGSTGRGEYDVHLLRHF